MTFRLVLLIALFCSSAFSADVIPAADRYPWEAGVTAGVRGGIAAYSAGRTIVPITGLDPTGVADAYGIIQGAINSASPNTVLTIPAGTFRLDSGVNVCGSTPNRNNITLRGAGMGTTILKCYGSASVGIGGSAAAGFPWEYPQVDITVAASKGDTSVTVSDVSGLDAVGLLCQFQPTNDWTIPVTNTAGFSPARCQLGIIVSVVGNVVTFTPELAMALPIGTKLSRVNVAPTPSYGNGIESLTIDTEESTNFISCIISYCYDSWLYKVESKQAKNYNINVGSSVFCEVRECFANTRQAAFLGGTSGAGLFVGSSVACLFEDNIMLNQFPLIEVETSTIACVFAYNFMTGSEAGLSGGSMGCAINANHGSYNCFNLYEGNVAARFQNDGLHGFGGIDTVARNFFHGTSATATNDFRPLTLNRGTRRYSVVGNLLGRTDYGITWQYSNAGQNYDTTSTTPATLADTDDTTTFTVAAGLQWNNSGAPALVYSASDPTKWMTGECTSYSGTTLQIDMRRKNGTGTYSDWIIVGGSGFGGGSRLIYSLGIPNIGTGGFNGTKVACAPQTLSVGWRCWPDGSPVVFTGNLNLSTAYICTPGVRVDGVNYVADGSYALTGSNSCTQWITNNPAKSGLTTWDLPSASSPDWLPWGDNSFQDMDVDAYKTARFRGNWNASTNSVPANEAMGGDTYPNSYYRTSKPAFFGTLTWPAFDPTNPPADQSTTAVFTLIPAGWRYINGNENYLNGSNTATVLGTTNVTGTLTLP